MPLNVRKLTPKQQAFADYYIELGNATQAAIKAGYSKRSARQIGEQNLSKHDIKAYIDARMKELKSQRIADQQEILETLTSVLRGEARAATLVGVGGGEEEINTEMPPTMSERIKAAELLGKRYAMWTDKQDVNVQGAVTFVDDISGDGE
ncbi:terminase small subunit [Ureibacillus thermophilus]|uniref:Terminase small subunit n=1 Tax=Ureibacillus thermophilus TaxID=367743 RepID=A0A4P6UY42_9BACL|nr:terminase small subunit [Ureibacillus thermophilus]